MAESVRFRFQCGDLPDDTFQVASFTGEEGISRLYHFDIDLVAIEGPNDDGIDIDDLQDQPSRLEITTSEHQRVIHGVVSRVKVLQQFEGHTVYRVALVPRAWALTLSAAHAVYLHRTTPEIINGLLEERLGLTELDREQALAADYRAWPFRLQYGESDWAFLSALMERDGIYYYFIPGEDGERIVFCDHSDGQPSLNRATIEYTASLGLEPAEVDDAIHSLVLCRERLPRELVLSNYNDEIPSTPITATAEVDPRGVGRVSQYGQTVLDPDEAEELAAIRAEEIYCTKEVYHGESTSFRLAAGHRFELTGHPRTRHNGAYQILAVEHEGHDPEVCGRVGRAAEGDTPVYDNRFTALPAEVQYRPPRTTERPRIQGTVNAHIDAEGDGTYAEVNAEGQYRVVFPFHRGFHDAERTDAGKASHWLRLMQPYGGEREGMHFPLRKGARVLVGFVGGNPDLPVINGVLPNAEQPSVVDDSNLAKGTIRTPGGNLFEFDDEKPRIKFYSPTGRTYLHLGAANNPVEGLVTATDGLAMWMALGGISVTALAQGWLVESDIWPIPTSDERNVDLNWYTLNEAAARDSESEWTVDDTIERVFQFPLKHVRPDQSQLKYRPYHKTYDNNPDSDANVSGNLITRDEELNNFIHANRTVGEQYSYRSGTDFTFLGPQREVFTFGPQASMDTYSRDTDADDLRAPLTKILKEFGDESAWDDLASGNEPGELTKGDYQKARVDYKIASSRRLREEALLVWGEPVTIDSDTDGSDGSVDTTSSSLKTRFEKEWLPSDDYDRVATISDVVSKAAEELLASYSSSSGSGKSALKQDVEGDLSDSETPESLDEMIGLIYTTDITDQLNAVGSDPIDESGDPRKFATFEDWFEDDIDPETGSEIHMDLAAQETQYKNSWKTYFHDTIVAHAKARASYDDDWENVKGQKDADLRSRLRNGRLSVSDLASISVGNGDSISYVRGRSYSETHIRENLELDPTNQSPESLVEFIDDEFDKTDCKGPNFSALSSQVEPYDGGDFIGDWTRDNVSVSKTIGNTYNYQKGSSINVQHGNIETITKTSRKFTETFNANNGKKIEEINWWADNQNTKKYNPHSGNLFSVEDVRWDSPSGYRKHTVTMHGVGEVDVHLGAKGKVTANLSMTANATLNVGSVTNTSLNLINHNDIKVGVGLIIEFSAAAGLIQLSNSSQYTNFPGLNLENMPAKIDRVTTSMTNKMVNVSRSVVTGEFASAAVRRRIASIYSGFTMNN